jgi:hypothetical protein
MDRRKRTRVLIALGVILALIAGIEYFIVYYKPPVESNFEAVPVKRVAVQKSEVPVPLKAVSTRPIDIADAKTTLNNPESKESAGEPRGSIEGMVVAQTKTLFKDWEIVAESMGREKNRGGHATVASGGRFLISRLPAGQFSLEATPSPDGDSYFVPAADPVIVQLAENEHKTGVILRVDVGLHVSGTVLDVTGNPIEGAVVTSLQARTDKEFAPGFEKTDKLGRFTLQGLSEGPCTLNISRAGFQTVSVEAVPGSQGLKIVLESSVVTIRGRVLDAKTGLPIQRYDVSFLPGDISYHGNRGNDERFLRLEPLHVQDPDGRFQTETNHAGGSVSLHARAKGYSPASTVLPDLLAGDIADVELRLESSITVRGQVINQKGEPVPDAYISIGAPVLIYGKDWERFAAAKTDGSGGFTIDTIPQGATTVSAWMGAPPRGQRPKPPGTASIPPANSDGVAEVEIVMPDSGARLITSVTLNGQPVPNAYVELRFDPSEFAMADMKVFGKTNEAGIWELQDLPEGDAVLRVVLTSYWDENYGDFAPSGVSLERSFQIRNDRECRQDVNLEQSAVYVHGQINYSRDVPMASGDGRITWTAANGDRYLNSAKLSTDNEFFMGGLASGPATLQIKLRGPVETLVDELYTIELSEGQVFTFTREY